MFVTCTMQDLRFFAVIALLLRVGEPRSVQLDVLKILKNLELNGGSEGNNYASLLSNAGGKIQLEDPAEIGDEKNSKIGFILFGNLEDLESYGIGLGENKNNEKINSDYMLKSAYQVNENRNDLVVVSEVSKESYDQLQNKNSLEEKDQNEDDRGKFLFRFEDDYEENDDSENYEDLEESESKDNALVDIFSEDEYNEYDEKDTADEDVSGENDESEEERFYDEEEKYYGDENNKHNNIENEGLFNAIFM